jgi:GNAT superfamily N-acetyltransferase
MLRTHGGNEIMEFQTIDHWDEKIWKKVSPVYFQAFAKKGAKPEKIIQNMFRKQICLLHMALKSEEVVAMALTGKLKDPNALLIDYLAVSEDVRGKGIGQKLLEYIKKWAITDGDVDSLLIEVESDATPANLARIHFWIKSGFTLTSYIHHYIWVPEPYRAMYLKVQPGLTLPESGEELFKYISRFHKESYQGS